MESYRGEKDGEIERLVLRARAGDSSAFATLVDRYRVRIYALALHVTGRESDADDVAQEVFLRAYRALDSFEGRGDFFAWIYRIALHLSFNVRRDRARRSGMTLDDPRVHFAVAVDAGHDPRRAAALRELYTRLLGALDRLSPSLRATLILVYLQGLSHGEAGEVLGVPQGTIAWRIHEARAQLRRLMGAEPERRTSPPASGSRRRMPPPPPQHVPDPRDARGAAEEPDPDRPDSGMFDLTSLSTTWR